MTTHKTPEERITALETDSKWLHPLLDRIAFQVEEIRDALPEISRKVNQHHSTYHDHCDFIKNSEREMEKVAAKKIMDHQNNIDSIDKKRLSWQKIGILLSLVAQWILLIWLLYENITKL
jgi:hypothetical protein